MKQKHRRFFKTHSSANNVINDNINCKYIFITRDFRDVVWSFYNHFTKSKYPLGDLKKRAVEKRLRECNNPYEFWKIIIQNTQKFKGISEYNIIWSYFETINSWLNVSEKKNVLILHFNDLKKDLKGAIGKIAHFLDYKYNKQLLYKIEERCTFQYMKKNSISCVPRHFKNNSQTFINKGVNKRWQNYFNEEDIKKYQILIKGHLEPKRIKWVEEGNHIKEIS